MVEMAVLGMISGIWSPATEQADSWECPIQSTSYAALSPSTDATGLHDKNGWKYVQLEGGSWFDVWRAPVGDEVWYCWHMNCQDYSQSGDQYLFFYAHNDGDSWGAGAVTGAVRVIIEHGTTADKWGLEAQQYTGAVWLTVGTAASNALDKGSDYYITLHLDKSGGTDAHTCSLYIGDSSQMLNSNNPYFTQTLSAANGFVDIVWTGTPCIYNKNNVAGKSSSKENDVLVAEVFVYDDDTSGSPSSRVDYYGAATQPHVFSLVGQEDSGTAGYDGEWTLTAAPAGCSTDAWRRVDDYHDDADEAADGLSCAGDGSQYDQMFEMYDDAGTPTRDWHISGQSPTVYGIAAIAEGADLNDVLNFLHYCPSEGGAPVSNTGTWVGVNVTYIFGVPMHQTPTHASTSGLVQIFIVHILGTQLQQIPNASACPAAVTRRIFITHNDAPIEYTPHIDGVPIGGCCS
jgi:hypothetical protein